MARFGLPSIISQIPNDLRQFLDRVREFIDAATRGDSQLVSRSGLIEAGIAVPGPGDILLPAAPPSDTTPPPAPAGLTASGTLTSIYLTWDLPAYTNHSYTKIWRALTDNFSNAVVIGSRAGAVRIFADSVGMGASYYYWIQHVSKADVTGPVVGTGTGQQGVYAYTATDNTAILTLLENALTGTHIQANAISSSELQALAVSTAHIQANAITSIHILAGSILAAHIQANAITAAQIQAGSITGDRIAAGAIIASHLSVADLSAVSANMGNLTAGTITLDQFGFIRSGNIAYASGIGFWMGYTGGAYKFYLGNPAGGYLDWNGSTLRIGGSAEFSGSLSGATGTFSGSLSAATGTFGGSVTGTGVIGTDQIQDSALTAPKIAAGSVIAGKIAANAISAAGGEIADLTVGTLKIQDQAVTVPVFTEIFMAVATYTDYGATDSGNASFISASITLDAPGDVLVIFNSYNTPYTVSYNREPISCASLISTNYSPYPLGVTLALYIDGAWHSDVISIPGAYVSGSGYRLVISPPWQFGSASTKISLAAGAHTIDIRYRWYGMYVAITNRLWFSSRSLLLLGVKK